MRVERRIDGRRDLRRPSRGVGARLEPLEGRQLLATAATGVALRGIEAIDSRSVTVAFEAAGLGDGGGVEVGLFRSADERFDPVEDRAIGSGRILADGAGTLVVEAADDGLRIDPSRPFVLAVADPTDAMAEADESDNVASVRKHILAVVTHGGIQGSSYPPEWAGRMNEALRAIGYDSAITYTWAAESSTPGATVKNGPRLANVILHASTLFPEGEPVDLHLIGHSQGTIVNSRALIALGRQTTPELAAGYVRATMLDPHAANNNAPGQMDATGGFLGRLARWTTHTYQDLASDPLLEVPAFVDDAEVYYQHTPVGVDGSPWSYYNLYGQAPAIGEARHFDITGPGMAHTGPTGVQSWYYVNVLPSLADGAAFEAPVALEARPRLAPGDRVADRDLIVTADATPSYAGSAAPGAKVRLLAESLDEPGFVLLGESTAADDGSWAIDARPLPPGHYRAVLRGVTPAGEGPWTEFYPLMSLGRVLVHPRPDDAAFSLGLDDEAPDSAITRRSIDGPRGLPARGRPSPMPEAPSTSFTPRWGDRGRELAASRWLSG